MNRYRWILVTGLVFASVGIGSAFTLVVTDPTVTARNAVTAVLKNQIVETLVEQHGRLRRMARRLSAFTNLDKYAASDVPRWRTHDWERGTFLYGYGYHGALTFGDVSGAEYERVARVRQPVGQTLASLAPDAREAVERALATLDLADSTIIAGTHQTGTLRYNGRRELQAIDELERHVIDPSDEQSATAVLDKISGAVLVGSRQKQARLQFLTAMVEQLLVDSKRARDTEAAVLNMQLGRLRALGAGEEGGGGFLTGAADDFRRWRQP